MVRIAVPVLRRSVKLSATSRCPGAQSQALQQFSTPITPRPPGAAGQRRVNRFYDGDVWMRRPGRIADACKTRAARIEMLVAKLGSSQTDVLVGLGKLTAGSS